MISTESGYALALLKTALAGDIIAQVADDLPVIEELVAQNARFFYDPTVTGKTKVDVLREALTGQANGLTVEFVVLLAQRRHLKSLSAVRRQYEKLAGAQLNVSTVKVSVPYEPNDELLGKLRAHLIKVGLCPSAPDVKVNFDVVVDKSLVGGFIAECGGKMLDMSFRTRLARLHQI